MHLVVDIRHWLDENDDPATLQLRRRVLRLARLIEYGGTLAQGETRLTLVECSRRPHRQACEGLLWVTKTDDDYLYAWCPRCEEDSVTITGWQDTLYADGPPQPFPASPPKDGLPSTKSRTCFRGAPCSAQGGERSGLVSLERDGGSR